MFKSRKQQLAFFAKIYPSKSDEWLGKNVPDKFLVLPKDALESALRMKGITKKDLATLTERKNMNYNMISVNPYTSDLDNFAVKKFLHLRISEVK